jgi:hypothetical protein
MNATVSARIDLGRFSLRVLHAFIPTVRKSHIENLSFCIERLCNGLFLSLTETPANVSCQQGPGAERKDRFGSSEYIRPNSTIPDTLYAVVRQLSMMMRCCSEGQRSFCIFGVYRRSFVRAAEPSRLPASKHFSKQALPILQPCTESSISEGSLTI